MKDGSKIFNYFLIEKVYLLDFVCYGIIVICVKKASLS